MNSTLAQKVIYLNTIKERDIFYTLYLNAINTNINTLRMSYMTDIISCEIETAFPRVYNVLNVPTDLVNQSIDRYCTIVYSTEENMCYIKTRLAQLLKQL